MIDVRCRTSLGPDYDILKWPRQMACRREVGDYVIADNTSPLNKKLRVISLTHMQVGGSPPILVVELSIP